MTWQAGLYVAAVLIPLAAFVIELLGGRRLKRNNAYVATAAIGLSFVLSLVGFVDYFFVEARGEVFAHHAEMAQEESEAEAKRDPAAHQAPAPAEAGVAARRVVKSAASMGHLGFIGPARFVRRGRWDDLCTDELAGRSLRRRRLDPAGRLRRRTPGRPPAQAE